MNDDICKTRSKGNPESTAAFESSDFSNLYEAEEEMADLLDACLPGLDGVEAALVRDCWLREPPVPLRHFAKEWGLTAKALTEVRERALVRLKDVMTEKGITSLANII